MEQPMRRSSSLLIRRRTSRTARNPLSHSWKSTIGDGILDLADQLVVMLLHVSVPIFPWHDHGDRAPKLWTVDLHLSAHDRKRISYTLNPRTRERANRRHRSLKRLRSGGERVAIQFALKMK